EAQILHVSRPARDLRRDVEARHRLADDAIVPGRARRRLRRRLAVEEAGRDELAIRDTLAARSDDDPVCDGERALWNAELGGGAHEEKGARLGAGEAQRRAALLDRLAAGGVAFVG